MMYSDISSDAHLDPVSHHEDSYKSGTSEGGDFSQSSGLSKNDSFPEALWRKVLSNDTGYSNNIATVHVSNNENMWELVDLSHPLKLLSFRGLRREKREFVMPCHGEAIGLCCTITCELAMSSTHGEQIFIPTDHMSFFSSKSHEVNIVFTAHPGAILLLVQLPKILLRNVFAEVELSHCLKTLFTDKSTQAKLKNINSPVSEAVFTAIRDICFAKYLPGLRKIFIQAKINEAIVGFVQQLALKEKQAVRCRMCQTMALSQKAEKILQENYTSPPSLDKLARDLGTNRNKLSLSFKAVHGKTVYEYCQHLRMSRAKRLLNSRCLSIAYVAEQVGYEHPGNFTAAYKRYFGELPKATRCHNLAK